MHAAARPDRDAAPLDLIADWPVPTAAAAVVGPSGVLAAYGDLAAEYRLASVTKPLVARAAQVAVEEGVVDLDTPAGPPGSHGAASAGARLGAGDELRGGAWPRPAPGGSTPTTASRCSPRRSRRTPASSSAAIWPRRSSNRWAWPPPGCDGGAAAAGFGGVSTVADLAAFAADLLRPRTVSAQMHAEATSVQFPGLTGVLPGFGSQRPNDWGLGFEIRDGKSPHWTGAANSPRTFGHFGQTGTFIWVDPDRDLALVVLTDRDFDDWAKPLWPALSDRF